MSGNSLPARTACPTHVGWMRSDFFCLGRLNTQLSIRAYPIIMRGRLSTVAPGLFFCRSTPLGSHCLVAASASRSPKSKAAPRLLIDMGAKQSRLDFFLQYVLFQLSPGMRRASPHAKGRCAHRKKRSSSLFPFALSKSAVPNSLKKGA